MTSFAPQLVTGGTPQLATANNAQTAGSGSSNGLDMTAFLKMFTTQLQYQDPTNPLESYELAAQLAQFSTVERLTEVNNNLLVEQALLTSVNNAQMVDMLGRQVSGLYDTVRVKDGQISKGQYTLSDPAANVTVKIYNEADELVRTITVGPSEAGQFDMGWDGKDDTGAAVSEGEYRFDVEATDADGNNLDVTKTVLGKVFAFRIENGTPYLILDGSGGLRLPINTVMEVQESV